MKSSAQKPTGKKLTWVLVVMATVAAVAGTQLPQRFFISLTPSIKYRLLWLNSDVENTTTGDYVVFKLNKKQLAGLPIPIELAEDQDGIINAVKRIGCDEGQILTRNGKNGRDFYCNGEYLGQAKERSKKGDLLAPAQLGGVIPHGKAFMSGDSKDSYDSRYFGFVDKKTFVYRATGIF